MKGGGEVELVMRRAARARGAMCSSARSARTRSFIRSATAQQLLISAHVRVVHWVCACMQEHSRVNQKKKKEHHHLCDPRERKKICMQQTNKHTTPLRACMTSRALIYRLHHSNLHNR